MADKSPVVLVTGSNRGLGLEFARQYAAEGWQVFAACRTPDDAGELKKLEAVSGGRVRVLPLDVMDVASVKAAAGVIGAQPVDLLLNNAGVMGPRNDRIGGIDYAAWARVLDTNTLGPMRVVEAFVANVAKGSQKKIVTITSGMGSLEDNTSGGAYAYRTSKAAVNMVVRSLALDLAPRGITCIVMNPGWVRTDMGGPRGTISPAESIKAMRSVIADLRPDDSGKFLNYTGKTYPW